MKTVKEVEFEKFIEDVFSGMDNHSDDIKMIRAYAWLIYSAFFEMKEFFSRITKQNDKLISKFNKEIYLLSTIQNMFIEMKKEIDNTRHDTDIILQNLFALNKSLKGDP